MEGIKKRDAPNGTRVLVADDSGTVRRLVARILSRAGFEVIEAVDGLDALALCALSRPHVAVLDYDMPGCDGLEVAQRIKNMPELCDIRVLMLTARTSSADASASLCAGADDFVRKPCDPMELVARVERVVALHRATEDLRRRSRTDELTGLPNRQGMSAILQAFSMPATAAMAVFLTDIDHFKRVNDIYGHSVGDAILLGVATRLASAWPLLTVARWGGEEFLGVAPVNSSDDALEIADRARLAVAREPIPTGTDHLALDVTVSVGVAVAERQVDTKTTIASADAALYVAKGSGRNRVALGSASQALLGNSA